MMWKQKNPEKRKISDQKYINNNKEKIKENFEKWIEINKEKHRKTTMKYKEKNREKILKYSNEWNKNNSDKIHNWNKEQYQNSSEYRIKSILYVRLNQALKAQDSPKFHHTLDLIGCTPEFLVNYLEEKMSDDMKLNRDLVDIDHIIPINTFDLNNVEEQKKCFHYTNLRPIFRKDNQSRPKDGSDFSPENGVSDNS